MSTITNYHYTMTTLTTSAEITQEMFIKGCVAGRRDAQERLYNYYSPKMFGICLRYAENYQSGEDILQEGFIKVFNNIDKFRGEGSLEGWIKRIFINTAIQHHRNLKKHGRHAELEEVRFEQVKEVAVDNMATQDLLQLIQQLAPGYRAVFNLYVIEGYSHKEIADKLNIAEGTSKSQLSRARELLQKMIQANEI